MNCSYYTVVFHKFQLPYVQNKALAQPLTPNCSGTVLFNCCIGVQTLEQLFCLTCPVAYADTSFV